MTTTIEPVLELLRWDHLPTAERILSAAIGRERAVLGTSEGILAISLDGVKRAVLPAALDLSAKVVASVTGDYVAVAEERRVRVWKWAEDEPLVDLSAVDDRTGITCSFGLSGVHEVFVCSFAPGTLGAYELPSGRQVSVHGLYTFRAQALSTVGTGTHVAAVGHFYGESKDSLAVIPMRELAEEPPSVVEERFARKLPIGDYAYRLAAGPCRENAIVFFRDPEDDEVPDEDDGEDSLEDTSGTALSTADIRGHRGFYIRTLDGALRSKVPWNGAIATGAQIASSHQWIAADCGDAVATLAVATPSQGRQLRGRWLGVSPDGCRILMATEQGQLGLLTLP